ncbi:CHAT domain-containing protein [Roseofilum sp. BLCC_M91]|uniref:CHAT domain-containing protein n=1 Tax=Roseofilum halophilum BLCC-M91 TaxID=3022259 RepID=A0ABT7BLN2_9CYAN|nr:CHAT domain-containing protein [Roseofilum halophilum]MDJ1180104.1 CHAT domain-containing protein [Roseofilum halophilum BLCC-M91]
MVGFWSGNHLYSRYKRRWVRFLAIAVAVALLVATGVPAVGTEQSRAFLATAETTDLIDKGRQLYRQQEYEQAIALWQEALDRFELRGETAQQALTLSYLALTDRHLGNWESAQTHLNRALKLLERSPSEVRIIAQVLNTQGQLYHGQGQFKAALSAWEKAEQAYQQAGDAEGVTGSQLNQASVLQQLGLNERSQEFLNALIERLESQPHSLLKVQALRTLGVSFHLAAQWRKAQELLEESLTLSQTLNTPLEMAQSLLSLGNLAKDCHHREVALDYYQQAIATTPDHLLLNVQATANLLRLHIEQQAFTDALELIAPLKADLNQLPLSHSSIYAHLNIAESLLRLFKLQPQLDPTLLETATQLTELTRQQSITLKDTRAQGWATLQLGKFYAENEQLETALELTQEALFMAQKIGAADLQARANWQQGQLFIKQEDRDSALVAYRSAVDTLESIRGDVVTTNPQMQFSFSDDIDPVYRGLIGLLLQTDKDSQKDPARVQEAREILEALQLAELDHFFREACRANRPKPIDKIDPKAAVIYPIILPDRLEVILTLPGQNQQHYSTPIPQPELEAHLYQMRQSLHPAYSNQERLKLYQQAYHWLIEPAESALKNHQIETLVFVLDSQLQNVPMAALYNGERYLIEDYAIALTKSLQLIQSPPLEPEKLQALTAGLSEARQGFRPLPGVASEVEQISHEIQTRVLLDRQFTAEELKKAIQETPFPIVHLATHGQFSSDAEETFILTWDSQINVRELDDLVRLRSSPTWQNPIELLVLSACKTAQGDERAILGLAGVALRSGARSTLATLWAVRDQSTAQFMVDFYQHLNQPGMSKAKALQQAQINLLHSQYHHPIYWAPFVMIGNWL